MLWMPFRALSACTSPVSYTHLSRFYRGQVDKYTWVDIGSSFLPSELNAAYLLAQLEQRAACLLYTSRCV